MADTTIHIGEMLARNARMYPDDVALVERIPAKKRRWEIVGIVIEVVPGKTLTEDTVLEFCRALPRYKRPRKVFFGPIPRNPTGKIEKVKLRETYIGTHKAFTLK